MKKPVLVLAAVIIVSLLGWRLWARHSFLYAGTIEATEIDLSSRITSVIDTYLVKESDSVKANQALVKMTCEDQRLAADWNEKDFRRADRLYKSGSAPQENYDRSKYQRDNAILQAQWCTVSSPIDGLVLQKYQESGERVNPGTKLLTVADLREVYTYLYVPQTLLAKLSLGMKLTGILPEMRDKHFDGVIRHIRQDAEFTPKNVQTQEERTRLVYGVKIYFANPDLILKPGMTIEVKLPE